MLQSEIRRILKQKISKEEKIEQFRTCFERHDVQFYVDLDGTLTSHAAVYYVKIRFLKLFKNPKKEYAGLLRSYRINRKFLKVAKKKRIKKIVVLTRNYHDFLEYFISATHETFSKAGLEIIGGIGRSEDFFMQSSDKLAMLPDDALLISDLFEYQSFKHAKQFVCIERFSWVKYVMLVIRKVVAFFGFLIRRFG